MQRTRKDADFTDAWVRVIPGTVAVAAESPSRTAQTKKADLIVQASNKREPEVVTEKTPENAPVTKDKQQNIEPVKELQKDQSIVYTPKPDGIVVTDNAPIKQFPKMTLGNTEVFLSLYNATNNRIVPGVVTVIEPESDKALKQVSGNEYLILPNPKNKSGKLVLQCEAFGYRKVEHEINFTLPLADTVKDYIDLMGTTFVVNFDLVRYHKGDIATLFNVYFYNDAAIMLPESKQELSNLLALLEENPHYKITLHGHTNGNYHGKIITMGEDKKFFSLDGARSTVGSAKDLSYNRAEAIKEYLEANRIDPARIQVKAWGGKRPIYDKHSVNAKKNVRVEIEIMDE
jgi:outer membrane protein OmpA-like peptidoglycan-associated protein